MPSRQLIYKSNWAYDTWILGDHEDDAVYDTKRERAYGVRLVERIYITIFISDSNFMYCLGVKLMTLVLLAPCFHQYVFILVFSIFIDVLKGRSNAIMHSDLFTQFIFIMLKNWKFRKKKNK